MKIKHLYSKYKEQIDYLFWGGATTAVNWAVYFLCTRVFSIGSIVSSVLAWLIAVLFAFWGNKCFVFDSKSWNAKIALPEFYKFAGARVFSGVLETGILWLCVYKLGLNDGVVKVFAGILVVILNYIFSKLIIFRRNENG